MNLTYEVTEDGYKIFKDGELWIAQYGFIPYPGATMDEAAKNHINEILAAQSAADAAAQQPTLEARVKALEDAQLAALGV